MNTLVSRGVGNCEVLLYYNGLVMEIIAVEQSGHQITINRSDYSSCTHTTHSSNNYTMIAVQAWLCISHNPFTSTVYPKEQLTKFPVAMASNKSLIE